mmetsp:Transcript_6839/g.23037  ORF Transcript_6839/g.23037 Transcript_6839/m.23037 type:complete len:202 (-) Transcript_6839:44-649(-)
MESESAVPLSQSVGLGLSQLSAQEVPRLCEVCVSRCLSPEGAQGEAPEEEGLSAAALQCVATLLLEAARHHAEPEQLRAAAAEFTSSPAVAEALAASYASHRAALTEHLLGTGPSFPSIVGLDWRLDHSVRSKRGGRDNAPLYFLSVKVKEAGVVRDVQMLASFEQVQDMLAKVRDAVKQVERVLAGAGELGGPEGPPGAA